MDTDAFPFQGVYLEDLEKGETVNIRLVLYMGIGEVLNLVYSDAGNLTSRYDVSCDVQ